MPRSIGAARRRAAPPLLLLGLGGLLARSFIGSSPAADRTRELRTGRAFFGGAPTGSEAPIPDAPAADAKHFVKGTQMYPPWPAGMEEAMFGMGCFWCSENIYMKMEGVFSTQVGYAGGSIPNPSYRDVCSGASNHNEVVRVVYDPKAISYAELLKVFWERHDPTTLNQQGNDRGTQYRSGIYYYTEEQRKIAEETKAAYQKALEGIRRNPISTEILPAPEFFYAEDYHQQYDAKPGTRQYCGLRPTGATLELGDMQTA
uniref:peptide-methionine (S)-S-oxide reductase n=1 Tax=Alexandrium monilatum TaxID=311494 RepID=A0A7S4RAL5_9DINO